MNIRKLPEEWQNKIIDKLAERRINNALERIEEVKSGAYHNKIKKLYADNNNLNLAQFDNAAKELFTDEELMPYFLASEEE